MGIIKAAIKSAAGALADQWLEVIEPDDMGDQTVFCRGVQVRRGANKKGSSETVSNGSVIHVYDHQFMMLVDGGRIVDYTAEPGYYTVDNSSLPSMFAGEFHEALDEAFARFKFAGVTPTRQVVFYINLQEIKGIKFGTRNPINYFDNFYNAELFLRAHGTYSIKITNPILFYQEALPKNKNRVEIEQINEQYLAEFLEALQTSINQMSADGTRISYVTSKSRELSQYMASVLDEEWGKSRGMEIQSVGIANISYDDESKKLIHMRNKGAMLSDPLIREGFVQGSIASGMEAAGSNAAGSMAGYMGMGMAVQTGGNVQQAASEANLAQMRMQPGNQNSMTQNQPYQNPAQQNSAAPQNQQTQNPQAAPGQGNQNPQAAPGQGTENPQAAPGQGTQNPQAAPGQGNQNPQAAPGQENQNPQAVPGQPNQNSEQPPQGAAAEWTCGCGQRNSGKFCTECGRPSPAMIWYCGCGAKNRGKFCSECGKPRP